MDYLVTMLPSEKCAPIIFGALYARSVPHILEHIFFSLDYKSFKTCMSVNKTWRELLSTERYKKRFEELLIEKKENEMKLFNACELGNAEEVKRLICDHMVNVDIVNEAEYFQPTPLMVAVRRGHYEIIKTLLEHGADIEKAGAYGHNPLMWAAISNIIFAVLVGNGVTPRKT